MTNVTHAPLAAPRFERHEGIRLSGINRRYVIDNLDQIPEQWRSFSARLNRLGAPDPGPSFGVMHGGGAGYFDYLTGVQWPEGRPRPAQMTALSLAAARYAVFSHAGPIGTLRATCDAIWDDWLPRSGHAVLDAPWYERYGDAFDPETGMGGLEVWIPIAD